MENIAQYAHEESQDVGHDDNEEIDLDQDDYEPKSMEDIDAIEDDHEDHDSSLFYTFTSL